MSGSSTTPQAEPEDEVTLIDLADMESALDEPQDEYYLMRPEGDKYRHRMSIIRIVNPEPHLNHVVAEITESSFDPDSIGEVVEVHEDLLQTQLLGYEEPADRAEAAPHPMHAFKGNLDEPTIHE